MRAVTYSRSGEPSVLALGDLPMPEPQAGEVRIRVVTSGVNPTDWKSRSSGMSPPEEPTVPNHDGAGVIDAVGPGVSTLHIGDRVWTTLAGDGRPRGGTAQEFTTVPVERVFRLPDAADFEQGAGIGIPAATAHRALTVAEDGPSRLAPHALDGRTVLVAGGAGAVGNAAIQLARWAGARVVTTVGSASNAALATAAGAELVIDRHAPDSAEQVRRFAPDGIDLVVEVAASANSRFDLAVVRPRATVAVYANEGGGAFELDVWRSMRLNLRYQFVLLYTVGWDRIGEAAADINAAIADGGLRHGPAAGIPIHRFSLDETAEAHAAVERGVTGKVVISVAEG